MKLKMRFLTLFLMIFVLSGTSFAEHDPPIGTGGGGLCAGQEEEHDPPIGTGGGGSLISEISENFTFVWSVIIRRF